MRLLREGVGREVHEVEEFCLPRLQQERCPVLLRQVHFHRTAHYLLRLPAESATENVSAIFDLHVAQNKNQADSHVQECRQRHFACEL